MITIIETRKNMQGQAVVAIFVVVVVILAWIMIGKREGFVSNNPFKSCDHDLSTARVVAQEKPVTWNVPTSYNPMKDKEYIMKKLQLLQKDIGREPRCKSCIEEVFFILEIYANSHLLADAETRFGNSVQKLSDLVREVKRQWLGGREYSRMAQKIKVIRETFDKYLPSC